MARSEYEGRAYRIRLALLFLCAAACPLPDAVAGAIPQCGAIERATLPDPAVCRRRFDADAPDALFSAADARIKAGDFGAAEIALGCAASALADRDDEALRYEWVRRRGVLAYRRERIPDALAQFECALQMSTRREDRVATARDLKNVGTALRRLGDFRGALRALTDSLRMQREAGEVGGAVLNNIADVYRDLNEPDEAMRFYRESLEAFDGKGERTEAAHVLESMSALSLDRGDLRQATQWLERALATYRDEGDRAYELRVYGGLIRVALAAGALDDAQRWAASAQAVAGAPHGDESLPMPASLQLQLARTERLSGRHAAAEGRVLGTLAGLDEAASERAGLLEELAAIREATGDRVGALRALRESHARAQAVARAQNDRQLDWLRTRFETAERDRTIAALEADNRLRRAELRQRTLLLGFTVAAGIAVALAVWSFQQRRRQRERLREEAHRVRQEEELARYRREADALAEDRSLLQALFDSREDALCLLDGDGQVLAANRAACGLLGAGAAAPVGHPLAEHLADADRDALGAALERMEDSAAHEIELAARDGRRLSARLAQWAHGDGLIVLGLRPREDDIAPESGTASATALASASTAAEPGDAGMREEFRRALVELMLAVVDTWERTTGTTRLELAEKSRIWRVTVDDGRLRVRAMERYLALSKLPNNPRWRDVLRSAYYVLGQCAMEAPAREALQRRVDAVLAYTRRSALV
ncbi:MAG: tetratricopeptide repeat protein [Pseudomonadota bacterium]